MMSRRAAGLVVAAWAGASCTLLTPFRVDPRGDGGVDSDVEADVDGDADSGADGDVSEDADLAGDADTPFGEGPLVLVTETIEFSAEPRCDVDGDGTLDNTIAALGSDQAEVFALAVNAALARSLSGEFHPVLHIQWIDDLSGPSDPGASLATYVGVETDYPRDPSDDFDGAEPFYVSTNDLGPCGEPSHIIEDVPLSDGSFSLNGGFLSISTSEGTARLHIVEATGQIEPTGPTFSLRVCGHGSIGDFGNLAAEMGSDGESFLELLLGGGAAWGLDIPGISPDVDLDGDGMELLILDEEGHIEMCVDGDTTIVEGRDCWRDPRIADAFSLAVDFSGVGARFGGRRPGWEYAVPHTCEAGPAPDGFFSTIDERDTPCAALDEICDPLASRPCCDLLHHCSGADERTYRCYPPCVPSPCIHSGDRLGACLQTRYEVGPTCWMVAPTYDRADCTPGDAGCTTDYGVTDNTMCFLKADRPICAELCDDPAAPCASNHRCIPLAFEPGGVCALR